MPTLTHHGERSRIANTEFFAIWNFKPVSGGAEGRSVDRGVARKATDSAFLRALVIPFGTAGCVELFEIIDPGTIVVGAVRHRREDDCH